MLRNYKVVFVMRSKCQRFSNSDGVGNNITETNVVVIGYSRWVNGYNQVTAVEMDVGKLWHGLIL